MHLLATVFADKKILEDGVNWVFKNYQKFWPVLRDNLGYLTSPELLEITGIVLVNLTGNGLDQIQSLVRDNDMVMTHSINLFICDDVKV